MISREEERRKVDIITEAARANDVETARATAEELVSCMRDLRRDMTDQLIRLSDQIEREIERHDQLVEVLIHVLKKKP